MIKTVKKVFHNPQKSNRQRQIKKNDRFLSFPHFFDVDKKWIFGENCE